MRIVLIKDYAVALKVLPEGTELRVSNKLGAELIKLEVEPAPRLGNFVSSKDIQESSAFVAALRTGLKSKLSRSSYFVPEFIDVYDGIVA